MKRLLLVVVAGILVGFAAYAVFAQEKEKMGQAMPPPMMPQKGPGQMMCPMGCPMGMMMCNRTMVTTEDGGVIILAGCKLVKYDEELNKVKEAQVEMDVEAMKAQMQKMMKACGCPMCQQMMKTMQPMGEEKKTQ